MRKDISLGIEHGSRLTALAYILRIFNQHEACTPSVRKDLQRSLQGLTEPGLSVGLAMCAIADTRQQYAIDRFSDRAVREAVLILARAGVLIAPVRRQEDARISRAEEKYGLRVCTQKAS